jgi:hypothetical protein
MAASSGLEWSPGCASSGDMPQVIPLNCHGNRNCYRFTCIFCCRRFIVALGTCTLRREVQPSNTLLSIMFTSSGITIFLNDVHWENAHFLIVVIEFGIYSLEWLTVHEETLFYDFNFREIHFHQLFSSLESPQLYSNYTWRDIDFH